MMQGITRSPSFISKALYAADATLVAQSGLDKTRRAQAYRAIDPFVIGMVQGRIDQDQAVLELLLDKSATTPRLHTRFSITRATAWHQAPMSTTASSTAQ